MPSAVAVVRKAAVKEERVADSVTLDHRARRDHHRDVTTDKGLSIHVHLHDAGALRDGDALKLDDDRLVRVRAASEQLYEITSANAARLSRLAWHLGSNHVPTEATPEALYVFADQNLDELIRGQGLTFTRVTRPFEPERDASHHHHHGHDHHHGHGHEHHHGHAHHDHGHKHEHHDHAHDDHAHHEHHHEKHAHGHAHAHDHHHDAPKRG